MDVPAVVERLATDAGASTTLRDLGWQGGVYRQFACKPPPGRVGWVDISVHRFPDAPSATEAVAHFAASRAESMDLQSVPATTIGDSSAALTGRAVNGTEYSLYLSEGPLLYAVTGVAPDSGSDPRADVEAIATALLASSAPVQVNESPAPSEAIPPALAPIPTKTPVPTLVPIPVPTATLVPPTATPVPTAPPMLAAIPTATLVPTLTPPPTVAPTPIPTAPLPAAPPSPTATTGPLPTATPRVIHRPPDNP
jgi:hypothetical protein